MNIIPSKISSGAGFEFENKVAAYYLTFMLTNKSPYSAENEIIKEMHFQVGVDGWLIDDLLIVLDNNGEAKRIAISIKSNQQFTSKKAPKDFVERIWKQYLKKDKNPFKLGLDNLEIIVSSVPHSVSKNVNSLFDKIYNQPPELLHIRMSQIGFANQIERNLFDSLNPSEEICKENNIENKDIASFLKSIKVEEFDFEKKSIMLNKALQNCKECLVKNDDSEIRKLWSSLLTYCAEVKANSGIITKTTLNSYLKNVFQLKDHETFEEDWKKLRSITNDYIKSIPDSINQKIIVTREKYIKEFQANAKQYNFIIGESGCGKTAFVKSLVKTFTMENYFWINATDLENMTYIQFENSLNLKNPLEKLFAHSMSPRFYLVIDGVDRVYSKSIFSIISNLISKILTKNDSQIIFTLQSEEQNRIFSQLADVNILFKESSKIELNNFDYDEMKLIFKDFPELRTLYLKPHLKKFISRPKVIDIIAQNIPGLNIQDTNYLINETNMIDWIWINSISNKQNGEMMSRFLQTLSSIQADEFRQMINTDKFQISDLSILPDLKKEKLCVVKNDKINFSHDLFGDWSRLKILLLNANNIIEFIEPKLTSPLWCKAFRLYCVRLIENDLKAWRDLLLNFSHSVLGQDIILEAIIFASDNHIVLESVATDLIKDENKILIRFLKKFLHSGTISGAYLPEMGDVKETDEIELAAYIRYPIFLYWIGVIQFLYHHQNEIQKFIPEVVAITDMWLRNTKPNYPSRIEAATLAIGIAESVLGFAKSENSYLKDKEFEKLAYKSGIAAYHEYPDRVINFCLIAASRIKPITQVKEIIIKNNKELKEIKKPLKTNKVLNKKQIQLLTTSVLSEKVKKKPWKYGPLERPNSSFQELCLNTDALHPIIINNANLAKEIILALLINEPIKSRDRYGHISHMDSGLYLKSFVWSPPMYFNGPILFFLNNNFEIGLELIVTLINFVTDRWIEDEKKMGHNPTYLFINHKGYNRKWFGDDQFYYAFRDTNIFPDVAASVLMSLEKWFYDNISDSNKINKAIDYIFRHSNSLAFAGLLLNIGKKDNAYLYGALFPLLKIFPFYMVDNWSISQCEDHQMIGWSFKYSYLVKLANEWHNLSHRKIQLESILINLVAANTDEFNKKIPEIVRSFKKEEKLLREFSNEYIYIHKLLSILDKGKWKVQYLEDNKVNINLTMPDAIQNFIDKESEENELNHLIMSTPMRAKLMLEDGEKYKYFTPEQLISHINELENIPSKIKESEKLITVDDAICGLICVLFTNYSDWLDNNLEMKNYCKNKIINIINNPTNNYLNEIDESWNSMNWNSFASLVIPKIWAEDPKNELLRSCIGKLALHPQYTSQSILIKTSAKYSKELGVNFFQLINVVLYYSSYKWNYFREKNYNDIEYKKLLSELVNRFVNFKMSKKILSLKFVSEYDKIKEKNNRQTKDIGHRYGIGRLLDTKMVQGAFTWVLDYSFENETDLELLESIVDNLFEYQSLLLEEELSFNSNAHYPNDWERWLYDLISRFMYITNVRISEKYWKLIFNLDIEAHDFIKFFMHHFILHGLSNLNNKNKFEIVWNNMLSFAQNNKCWNPTQNKSYYAEEIWISLLGIDSYSVDRWNETNNDIIKKHFHFYKNWAALNLKSEKSALAFLQFLKQPLTKDVVMESIILLKDYVNLEEVFRDKKTLENSLATFEVHCWSVYKDSIVNNKTILDAFKELNLKLVERQNIVAMELQSHLFV